MAKPYPQELRDRVLGAYDRGMKTKQIAEIFAVCPAWARRIKQRRRETGETTPRPMGGVTVTKIELQRLRELVAQQPDATIKQLHQRLGIVCSESAVGMALKRLGLSVKKKRCMRRSRTGRTLQSSVSNGGRISPGVQPLV